MASNNKISLDFLRQIRNAYLKDMDSEVIKFASKNQPLPYELSKYLQELRDIPEKVSVLLDENNYVDESSVEWPVPPVWWWNKKGFDQKQGTSNGTKPYTKEKEIRAERDAKLGETDWLVTRATETGEPVPSEWAAYRQALRDVPQQDGFPENIIWPEEPEV